MPDGKNIKRRFAIDQHCRELFDWCDVTMTDRRSIDLIDGFELHSTSNPRRRIARDTHEDATFDDVGFKQKVTMDVVPRPAVVENGNADDAPKFDLSSLLF